MISKKEIENLAKLSKLKFTDEELENFTKEMTDIIAFADTINRNAGVAGESTEIFDGAEMDELREDEVKPSYPNEEIVSNTDAVNGFFVVRRNCCK